MGKRFTESGKWMDSWFRRLTAAQKLGYLYLLDNCDAAGVADLDHDLANFQIGSEVDWDALVGCSEGRIEKLESGKLWLTRFVSFQYGELSDECRPHKAVLALIEKHKLDQRVSKGYPKGIDTLQDKDKDKDKDKDNKKKKEVSPPPDTSEIEPPALREAVDGWLVYKAERKEIYKASGLRALLSRVKNLAAEHSPQAVVDAIQRAMANDWKGFDHDIGSPPRGSPRRDPSDPRGTRAAALAFLEMHKHGES